MQIEASRLFANGVGHTNGALRDSAHSERDSAGAEAVLETLPAAIVGVSPEATIAIWSRGAERLFGYTRSEILGTPVWRLIPPAGESRAREVLARVRRGERIEHFESERLGKDGIAIPVISTIAPMPGRPGTIIATVIEDLRPQRRARQALERSEAAFQALVERCPEPIFVHRHGVLVYVNPAMLALSDYSREEILGRSIVEALVHPEDRALVQRRVEEAAISAQPLPPIEVRVRRRDGSVRMAETIAAPIEFEGEPATLVMARDITERKRLQSRLMVSDRMASIGTLAAGIAHEINNPLAYLLGNLEVALDEIRAIAGASPSQRLRELDASLSLARGGAERILRIVRGLKTFSRADEERRVPLDVNEVLEVAINMSFNEIRHRARLVKQLGRVPKVDADEARLCQVFVNLLVNAAQAIPEGEADQHEIRLTTRCDAGGRVVIEVLDTGSGIPAELSGRIFDPFFTTKPVGVGTGLGLSICHGIVTSLGGEITMESQPGRGSLFRVLLMPAPAAIGSEPESRRASAAPRRGRILIVDDDPGVGAVVRGMLPEHEVAVVGSGREALDRVEQGATYDAIVCDLMMPEMTGMDLHERLRSVRPDLTARMIASLPQLEKPFARQELRARVHALLAQDL